MRLIKLTSDRNYILLADLIWDGIAEVPYKDHAVIVKGGIVAHVGPVSEINYNDRTNLQVIDMPGTTIIPGMVDCHVHFAMNSVNLFKAIDDWTNHPEIALALAEKAACDYLDYGIVSVRDGSDRTGIGLTVRERVLKRQIPGPLVTATGMAIYKKTMYGSFLGPGVQTVNEALLQIHELASAGVDQIKIVLSGLVSFKQFGSVGPVQFSLEELIPIVEACHSLGLKIMAHASSDSAVKTGVLAGVDSVEHGYFITTETLELMNKYKTAWIPTLAPLGNLLSGKHIPYEGADLRVIDKTFKQHLSKVREAAQMGILLGIGTDAGANHVFHGKSYYSELEYYSQAGLDNLSILKAATSGSAAINGAGDILGTIIPGKRPFLCCVNGNPLKNLACLQNPQTVIVPDPF